jgi:5-methylcytosine-specific restriction endonuclease McrA
MTQKKDLSVAANRDDAAGIEKPRSPHWPAVEHAHLKEQPVCACCGSDKKLNVHHKKPFHLFPELELEPTNLITLCMDKECHLLLGHGDNFKDYNPNVEEDVKRVHDNMNLFESVSAEAKAKRLSQ